LEFETLVKTGDQTGEIGIMDVRQNERDTRLLRYVRQRTEKKYALAARIRGHLRDDLTMSDLGSPLVAQAVPPPPLRKSDEPENDQANPPEGEARDTSSPPTAAGSGSSTQDAASDDTRDPEIHVVYVCDIDLLSSTFIALRANPDSEIEWDFDNVPFVLNVVDSLAGDNSLLGVRKRKTRFGSLRRVDQETDGARQKSLNETQKFEEDFNKARDEAIARRDAQKKEQEELEQSILEARRRGEGMTPEQYTKLVKLRVNQERALRMFDIEVERLERERDQKKRRIDNELEMEVRRVQAAYKWQALLLPLIPPSIVGVIVYWLRRRREMESVGLARRR
jgi:ABC-2 type transport system permease protein